ncbi:hypothetical protein [Pectinatus sottacetonis]|uniref:hypothetical protein n=1 Tax=Pectinatus sottacetonis TaxID=1002795 RepID=UPI0018C70491|nr:hypothetical protein [Pectinatus sottacetonis]
MKKIFLVILIASLFSFSMEPSMAATVENVGQNTAFTSLVKQDQTKDAVSSKKNSSVDKKDEAVFKKVENAEENNNKRFVLIAKDDKFYYYLDRKSARWILEPNTDRQIMDVWIRLVDANKKDEPSNTYSKITTDSTYLLDHYYIRPVTRQVQFLCELEVTGYPANDIKQNNYSVKNWEDVVPGSVEETIYNGVMLTKGSLVKIPVKNKGIDREASDFLDRVLNISL